jgi:uncharacterized membrane protein YjgN (DUF898 family)
VVIVFIGLGWGFINNANHTPFIPVNEGEALLSSGKMSFLNFFSSDYFGHYGCLITGVVFLLLLVLMPFLLLRKSEKSTKGI